ncbi:MAG: hypothetical protein Q4F00_13855 [bacterium]|nr:hypothetical protein [bacterium]
MSISSVNNFNFAQTNSIADNKGAANITNKEENSAIEQSDVFSSAEEQQEEPSQKLSLGARFARNLMGVAGGTVGGVAGVVKGAVSGSINNVETHPVARKALQIIGASAGLIAGVALAATAGGPIGAVAGLVAGPFIGAMAGGATEGAASSLSSALKGAVPGGANGAKKGFEAGRNLFDQIAAKPDAPKLPPTVNPPEVK